jgi:Mce-associated membrane protein
VTTDEKTEVVDAESTAIELGDEDTTEDTAKAADTDAAGGDAAVAEDTASAAPRTRGPFTRGVRRWAVPALLVVLLLASAGVAAWMYYYQYRPDQQTNADAQKVALDAASTGAVALLSYSPDTLEKDFAAAKDRLTGDFLNYYTQFTQQIVTPAAKEKQVKTQAAIVQAAVSEIHPDSATVLLFINQTTTSKENPDGAFAASSVKVGLTKIDGRWLISAFDPV